MASTEMKEYGILFKPEMAEAVRRVRNPKTETRRIPRKDSGLNVQHYKRFLHDWALSGFEGMDGRHAVFEMQTDVDDSMEVRIRCPYGKKGDVLWVRETWGCPAADHPRCKGGRKPTEGDKIVYLGDPADAYQWDQPGHPGIADFCWRSPIHLPRWATRTLLEVVSTDLERLQDITETGVDAEGVFNESGLHLWDCYGEQFHPDQTCDCGDNTPQEEFAKLWDSINGGRGLVPFTSLHPDTVRLDYTWTSNPMVWVVKFRLIESPTAEGG